MTFRGYFRELPDNLKEITNDAIFLNEVGIRDRYDFIRRGFRFSSWIRGMSYAKLSIIFFGYIGDFPIEYYPELREALGDNVHRFVRRGMSMYRQTFNKSWILATLIVENELELSLREKVLLTSPHRRMSPDELSPLIRLFYDEISYLDSRIAIVDLTRSMAEFYTDEDRRRVVRYIQGRNRVVDDTIAKTIECLATLFPEGEAPLKEITSIINDLVTQQISKRRARALLIELLWGVEELDNVVDSCLQALDHSRYRGILRRSTLEDIEEGLDEGFGQQTFTVIASNFVEDDYGLIDLSSYREL
jgi:hypothetical protein